jgi:FAD/FMN-containing dehydrogenase
MDNRIMSLLGETINISETDLSSFKKNFSGQVLTKEEKDYNEVRLIWNGMISKNPGLIARCKTSKDVSLAVKFARNHNLLASIRGGGHNVAGNAVCDGGLMIDLSLMNNVSVDQKKMTAVVGPGCTLGNADQETQKFGLVIPSGIVTGTGLAGLTLGGGFGWLSRKWGLTCDHLISTEVVTAEGEIIKVSDTENTDLFWGIKGGGGNFGIVTSFEFSLRELGPEITGGLILYKIDSMGSGYINFASADETQERVAATYGQKKYEKLVDLKRKYDPDNFFRLNQNIKP